MLREAREAVIAGYGGRCVCCGERRYEFLAVDHINGLVPGNPIDFTPAGNRRVAVTFLRVLIRLGFPADYRLLCHNCNAARGYYGFCPHERE